MAEHEPDFFSLIRLACLLACQRKRMLLSATKIVCKLTRPWRFPIFSEWFLLVINCSLILFYCSFLLLG